MLSWLKVFSLLFVANLVFGFYLISNAFGLLAIDFCDNDGASVFGLVWRKSKETLGAQAVRKKSNDKVGRPQDLLKAFLFRFKCKSGPVAVHAFFYGYSAFWGNAFAFYLGYSGWDKDVKTLDFFFLLLLSICFLDTLLYGWIMKAFSRNLNLPVLIVTVRY